jgi:hypothetical protein
MRRRGEAPIVALKSRDGERTRTLSETATLIAGVLLTSVGLLALLPYVLKRGWRQRTGNLAVDSGYGSVLAAIDAFEGSPGDASFGEEDIEELLAHLFTLRMTVSEVTAEVRDARDLLEDDGAADEDEPEEATAPVRDAA